MSSWLLEALGGSSHHSSAISLVYCASIYPTICCLVSYHSN
uniref:Uncharacterized protein n=1 Tax=Arundo donax TaxID=35708 RepID=A0A0A9AKN8_ARUDO